MSAPDPVLLLGGYGSLGSRIARLLRRRHPDLPLVIAGRDPTRGQVLADELGLADAVTVDLTRPDLHLGFDRRFSVVVAALRDHSLNAVTYAQRQGAAYVALSEAAFELPPIIAAYVSQPAASPILIVSHSVGSAVSVTAAEAASAFHPVESIALGLTLDPRDPFGAQSAVDMERIARVGPAPLLRENGGWRWAAGAGRAFAGPSGAARVAGAYGLSDVLGLVASTGAAAVRLDIAEGATVPAGALEATIEILGGGRRRVVDLNDPEGHAWLSAKGVVLNLERLLGLNGAPPPGPGLYLPEVLLDSTEFVEGLRAMGVSIMDRAGSGDQPLSETTQPTSSAASGAS